MSDAEKAVPRLKRKVSKWLKEWVVMPDMIESHRDEPTQMLQKYLTDSEDERLVSINILRKSLWHFINYEHAVLNEGETGQEHLVLAVIHAESGLKLEAARVPLGWNGVFTVSEAALYLALAVIANFNLAADRIAQILVKGLDTRLLDLRHNDRHSAGELYPHFWFIMHLQEKYWKRPIDIRQYSYPPDMSPYKETLKHRDSTDMKRVHDLVCAMADYHVLKAQNTKRDEMNEFDMEDVMLFPFGILCWLRMREWMGLKNPEKFAHPLMRQPLAQLPVASGITRLAMPPLLADVEKKFRLEHPEGFA